LQVQSPEDVVPYINLLIYGEPGAGKTFFCSTAQDIEETKPILFVDVEGGVLTIRKRPDIDVKAVRSIKDVEDVHNMIFKDPSYYRTVIVDSLSELQKLDMRFVMNHEKQNSSNPDRVDIDTPTQRAWGKSGERIRRIVRAFRDLPCNTIMTTLVSTEYEEDDKGKEDKSKVRLFYPMLPGKLRGEIPGYFDVVGFLQADADRSGNIKRTLQVAKTKRVVAKDRTGSLGLVVNEPSIPIIWNMIHSDEKVMSST